MSSFVEKIIEEKSKQLKAESIEAINKVAEAATARFQTELESLKKQAKIVLPVNILDILVEGGYVFTVIHNVPSEGYRVDVEIGSENILYEYNRNLKAGKYRVTLLLEKLGPPEKRDC